MFCHAGDTCASDVTPVVFGGFAASIMKTPHRRRHAEIDDRQCRFNARRRKFRWKRSPTNQSNSATSAKHVIIVNRGLDKTMGHPQPGQPRHGRRSAKHGRSAPASGWNHSRTQATSSTPAAPRANQRAMRDTGSLAGGTFRLDAPRRAATRAEPVHHLGRRRLNEGGPGRTSSYVSVNAKSSPPS